MKLILFTLFLLFLSVNSTTKKNLLINCLFDKVDTDNNHIITIEEINDLYSRNQILSTLYKEEFGADRIMRTCDVDNNMILRKYDLEHEESCLNSKNNGVIDFLYKLCNTIK